MATIKPFNSIHSSVKYVQAIEIDTETIRLRTAHEKCDEDALSDLCRLVPQKSSGNVEINRQNVYQSIKYNFRKLLNGKQLIQDKEPSVYIVEVSTGQSAHRGIWALTSVDDYLHDRIRKHEQTIPKKKIEIVDYFVSTGLDAVPVLITYPDNLVLTEFSNHYCGNEPFLCIGNKGNKFKIWRVNDSKNISAIVRIFSDMPITYIADGHHRAAAAADAHLNFFSTVYMPVSQLKVLAFHRLIKNLNGLSTQAFLTAVRRNFHINQVSSFKEFDIAGSIKMYLSGLSFILMPKEHILNRGSFTDHLETSLIRDFILTPVLNIADVQDDSRIEFVPGTEPEEEIQKKVDQGEFVLAFLLRPPSSDLIVKVADLGETMPPKSTFVLPKFPPGLLIHQLED